MTQQKSQQSSYNKAFNNYPYFNMQGKFMLDSAALYFEFFGEAMIHNIFFQYASSNKYKGVTEK